MLKLLRGTLKHWVAISVEWNCDKMDWLLNAMRFRVYDVLDWAAQLHLDAHDDLDIDEFPGTEDE